MSNWCDIIVRSLAVQGGGDLGRLLMQIKEPSKVCFRRAHRRTLIKKALVWEEC